MLHLMCCLNQCINVYCFMIDVSALRHGRRLEMVQKAQMSSGQAGGGGQNTLYYVLIGATCLGTGVYVRTPFYDSYSSVYIF